MSLNESCRNWLNDCAGEASELCITAVAFVLVVTIGAGVLADAVDASLDTSTEVFGQIGN